MYIIYVLLSAFCFGFYDLFKKMSLRKSSVYEILFFYCFSAFLLSLFFTNFNFLNVSLKSLFIILLKSAILVVNWLLVLVATKKLNVGVVTSFSLVTTIFVMIESALFFKEKITLIHLLSLFLIGSGILLVIKLSKKEDKGNINKYVFLLIISSFFASIVAMIDKYLLSIEGMDSSVSLSWYLLFNTIFYAVIYYIKDKKIDLKKVKENYYMILTGIAICLSDRLYFLSISTPESQISIIAILRRLNIIVSTILASIFLKEKQFLKKLWVLLIMLIGVALPIIF